MSKDYHENLGMSPFLLHIFGFRVYFVGHTLGTGMSI